MLILDDVFQQFKRQGGTIPKLLLREGKQLAHSAAKVIMVAGGGAGWGRMQLLYIAR